MTVFFYTDERPPKTFKSRWDALQRPEPCFMYFDDAEFAAADWSREPQEDLQELYRQRAQKIRDEHERVIVAYSGGIDSTVALESFLLNGIAVDEILVVGALSQDFAPGSDENHNGELYDNAFPLLKRLDLLGAKVTVVDYTELFADPKKLPVVSECGAEWYRGMGSMTSLHNFFWRDLHALLPHQRKKTAIVFGVDKPNFQRREDGKCYTWFHDTNVCSYYFRDADWLKRVNFYWDSADTKILRKQLHLIGRFYQQFVLSGKLSQASFLKNQTDIVESIVYKPANPLVFKSPKSRSNFVSLRDSYILKKLDSEIGKIFLSGVQALSGLQQPEFRKNLSYLETRRQEIFTLR